MSNPDAKRPALVLYLFDVEEIGANLELISDRQCRRLIKRYYSAIECCSARPAEVNDVEIAFYLTDASMEPGY